jgi:hypothetical protein
MRIPHIRHVVARVLVVLDAAGAGYQAGEGSGLPLEINDNFSFAKSNRPISPESVARKRKVNQSTLSAPGWSGAVDRYQIEQRVATTTPFSGALGAGRCHHPLEYRQAALGNYVMATERYYPQAKGSYKSEFTTAGDEHLEYGRITSWRVLLIVDGRIVAFRQSFMWR